MKKSKLYRVVTFPNIVAGLPSDYWIFLMVACLTSGYGSALIYGNSYVGVSIAAVLGGILYIFGFVKTIKDPHFFDVITTRLLKMSSSGHYEP